METNEEVMRLAKSGRDFESTLEKCREVTLEMVRHEKLYYKVVGSVMKFVAPLM